ncbi:MAG TPA: hypothetical protein VEF76_01840 [Patescibacteria group bacterium]|nr:hypothetical protein [Patescibacteria group bacterium]
MAFKDEQRELINRAFKIKPLVRDGNGTDFFVEANDLYDNFLFREQEPVAKAETLTLLKTIDVEIPVDFRQPPKPRIADVLPQIPDELLPQVSAFCLSLRDAMLSGEEISVTAKLTLYSGPLPENVDKQPVILRGKRFDTPLPEPKPDAATLFNPAAVRLKGPLASPGTAVFKPPKAAGPA